MIDLTTLAELPFQVAARYPKAVLLSRATSHGSVDLSSSQFAERTMEIAAGLADRGVRPGDRVAIVSESRPEWSLADLAVLSSGAITVPIYPTLSGPQSRYILNDAGIRFAIVSTAEQVAKLQAERPHTTLQAIIVIDATDETSAMEPAVLALATVAARGGQRLAQAPGAAAAHRAAAAAVTPDSLATIIYTSGTTGEPKGVMLSHANLVSNMRASSEVLTLSDADVALSFLPLSHVFERMVFYLYLAHGVTVVFAESLDTVGRDLAASRPTVVTGVPRVYEKIHDRILENVAQAPPLRRRIFHWAIGVGTAYARARLAAVRPGLGLRMQHGLADRLVFSKIRARTGGRLRFFVSGSAPLAPALAEFFEAAGLRIIEGYGLTETSPVLTVNPVDAPRFGTVGRPIRGVEIRIADDGEILARGPNVMLGYYNKPDETAATIRNGWLHTGDVGRFDEAGYLIITDRKKDLLITSGGKKLAPQPLEAVLKRSPLVTEALIVGEGRKFPAALLVPDFAGLETRLKTMGQPSGDRESLVTRPEVLALYQSLIDEVNRDLGQFERLKRFALLPTEFAVQSGELTPTMKVRRRVVEERWRTVIDGLYREDEGQATAGRSD